MTKKTTRFLIIIIAISLLALPFFVPAQASGDETFKMIQSHREINIVKGKGFTFEVGFKNQTNSTWTRMGAASVDLKLAPPFNRQTVVRHSFWRDSGTPAWLKGDQAKPGWLAYYQFALEAPTESGVYTEKFVLVDYADGHILSGSQFDIVLNVWNSESEFPKNQDQVVNAPAKVVTPQPQPVVEQDTTFARQCLNLSTKKFRLSETITQEFVGDCKDLGVDLAANIWVDPEPVVVNTNTDIDSQADNNTDTTTPTPSTADGPTMRIGLFHTIEPIIITASTGYKLKDSNGTFLASKSAGSQTSFTYNFATNTYNYGTGATSSYLRLEGDSLSTVFEIVSYEQRPAWNTNLNDNKFLNILEIRHSANTNRLWVINELAMETYLKGLAESSNSSPIEYQKALITAARTYAMHHHERQTKHADEYFILDSRYDQVYKGYGSQSRLPKISQAVEETKGIVVTYQGKVAITPYFSHSDGRTRSWSEVWGGDISWAQSVPEPAGYDKTTMYGHGVGMSAHGALLLAGDHGYNYDQILKYYFTGIELTKIY